MINESLQSQNEYRPNTKINHIRGLARSASFVSRSSSIQPNDTFKLIFVAVPIDYRENKCHKEQPLFQLLPFYEEDYSEAIDCMSDLANNGHRRFVKWKINDTSVQPKEEASLSLLYIYNRRCEIRCCCLYTDVFNNRRCYFSHLEAFIQDLATVVVYSDVLSLV